MKIYLIRHGRQCDKRCNVDVELSAEGFQQADLVGERMKDWGIQKVYSSDMIRARQTAETANKHWNVEHEIIPALREMHFGDMEGLTVEEMDRNYADFWKEEAKMERVMTYPGGESVTEVAERGIKALYQIVDSGLERVAVATHGVWIRAMVCYLFGIDMAKWKTLGVTFENSGITQIDYDTRKKIFTLERFNDAAHLEGHPELTRDAWGVKEA